MGLYYKLNWAKRASAVYSLLGTLLYPCHPDLSRFAVKLVNKTGDWDSKYSIPCDFRREVDVLDKVDHPCAIKVVEVIETDSLLAIVMEYAAGGELFDQVMKDEKAKLLQEDTAKFQFFQVVLSVVLRTNPFLCRWWIAFGTFIL